MQYSLGREDKNTSPVYDEDQINQGIAQRNTETKNNMQLEVTSSRTGSKAVWDAVGVPHPKGMSFFEYDPMELQRRPKTLQDGPT